MTGPTLTADVIIFSINSAIRLTNRFRKAYADSIKSKQIVLPLPHSNNQVQESTIERFFSKEGAVFVESVERLKTLNDQARNSRFREGSKELQEYREFYRICVGIVRGRDTGVNVEEGVNLLRIRQWEQGQVPRTSILQLVAGSLVEVGIDYFTQVPGALNKDSAQGRALRSFLMAFDTIDFAESEDLKKSISLELVPRLFASTAEAVSELSPAITGDKNLQELIRVTGKGIADDIFGRINQFSSGTDRQAALDWGPMVFKSMIKNAGTFVFTNSSEMFGTNDDAGALLDATGSAILKSILDSGEATGIDLKKVLTVDTLDAIMQSSFMALSEHPDWISKRKGIRLIVSGVASALASSGIKRPGLAPEFIRLILEQTALNIDQFWQDDPNGRENLLITGLREVLAAFSAPKNSGIWRPTISNSQLIGMIQSLTEKITQNPGWVTERMGEDSIMGRVVHTTFNSLAKIPRKDRFSAQSLQHLIQINLKAVATSPRVLSQIHWGNDQQEVVILEKGLDLVYGFALGDQQNLGVNRLSLIMDLADYTIDTVLSRNPNKKGLLLVDLLLFEETGIDFSNGFDQEFGNQLMASALNLLDQHPELVIKDQLFRQIITDTARSLKGTMVEREHLVPEIIRLVFQHTAGNLDLMMESGENKTSHLLAVSFREALRAISTPPTSGKWKPSFSNKQILGLLNVVSEEVISNPEWGRNERLVFEVVESVFAALEQVPNHKKLPFVVVEDLLKKSFAASTKVKELVLPFSSEGDNAGDQIVINYSMERFFVTLYKDNGNVKQEWNVNNTAVVLKLIDYFTSALSATKATKPEVDKVINQFEKAFTDYQNDVIHTTDELMAALNEPAIV